MKKVDGIEGTKKIVSHTQKTFTLLKPILLVLGDGISDNEPVSKNYFVL